MTMCKEITPLYSREYLADCGRPVRTLMLDPFHKYFEAGYVMYLEKELTKARNGWKTNRGHNP